VVSQWYRHLDKGHEFYITAIDEEAGTVEIQNFDGDLDEVELADWYKLDIEPIETPADWTGPVDDVEVDDLGYTETDMTAEDWSDPLAESDPRKRPGPEEGEGND
jgi:hypothetical protein